MSHKVRVRLLLVLYGDCATAVQLVVVVVVVVVVVIGTVVLL
jgi:hypothetical protein